MKNLLPIMVLFFNFAVFPQQGWNWQNPKPQGNNLNGLFVDDLGGFVAVGDYGTVIITTDGGDNFTVQHKICDFNGSLNSVFFPTSSVGYAVGANSSGTGKMFKTTDGGSGWSEISLPSPENVPQLTDVFFTSANTGWICGNEAPPGYYLCKTTDGGSSWVNQSNGWVTSDLKSIYFDDESNGYACGSYSAFIYTTDGGMMWFPTTGASGVNFEAFTKDPGGNWWTTVKEGEIYKSTNAGMNWVEKYSGNKELYSITFQNSNNGHAAGQDGVVLYTTNGGENWNAGVNNFGLRLAKTRAAGAVGFAIGWKGNVLKSLDGGQTWNPVGAATYTRHGENRGIWFLNENNGFLCGSFGLRKTTDGGVSWTDVDPPAQNALLNAVKFNDASNGLAVGAHGEIYKTTDGGSTWSLSSTSSFALSDVHYASSSVVYATGYDPDTPFGVILKSTDGGSTWVENNNTNISMSDISSDGSNVYAVGTVNDGSQGVILKSTDDGATWNEVKSTTKGLFSINMISGGNGIACGIDGATYKTTDGGATWAETITGLSNLNEVQFINSETVYMAGDAGSIYKSTNAGGNWSSQESKTNSNLTNILFPSGSAGKQNLLKSTNDIDLGWIIGDDGVILKTTDGGLPVELISFSAYCCNQTVFLNWKTETEVNNFGFEIERSLNNGIKWEKIGFVNGYGNSNSPKEYSFTDRPSGGSAFRYRLKQIDNDGIFEYSQEVKVIFEIPSGYSLEQNFPNPFNPATIIEFSLPSDNHVEIRVFDVLGRETAILLNEYKQAGTYRIGFDADGLTSGVYFYKMVSGSFTAIKIMVLLR